MILISFAVIGGGLLLVAGLFGGVSTMIDVVGGLAVVLSAAVFAVLTQPRAALLRGLKDIVSLRAPAGDDKDPAVARTYMALSAATLVVGVCYMIQGVCTATLRAGAPAEMTAAAWAASSLALLYALLLTGLVWLPVYFRHK